MRERNILRKTKYNQKYLYCLFKSPATSPFMFSLTRIHVGGRSGRICKSLCAKIICSLVKTCGMCIEDLNIYKGIGGNAYTNFFFRSSDRTKTRQRYIDIILLEIIEVVRLSRANIHISKCYSAKCCKEKIQNILGDRFMCEIILSHKHSFTDDLWTITYYIIYTLTRIENVLIYVAHAFIHYG